MTNNLEPGIDTTVFDLTGTHYDIGLAIGRASSPTALPSWWPEPPPIAYATACAREIAAIHPALLDEIHGHADAQQQPYDDLMRLICRQRLGGRLRPTIVPEQG